MLETSRNTRNEDDKKAYMRNIRAKLAEKNARLRHIKRKIQKAMESRQIEPSEQLLKAQYRADSSIKVLQERLDLLGIADHKSWETLRFDVDMAWDELSQAIKIIIARFP
jgi:hypothetical protein